MVRSTQYNATWGRAVHCLFSAPCPFASHQSRPSPTLNLIRIFPFFSLHDTEKCDFFFWRFWAKKREAGENGRFLREKWIRCWKIENAFWRQRPLSPWSSTKGKITIFWLTSVRLEKIAKMSFFVFFGISVFIVIVLARFCVPVLYLLLGQVTDSVLEIHWILV